MLEVTLKAQMVGIMARLAMRIQRIQRGGRAYRGEIAKSSLSGSGSDQTRSAIGPSCGISGKAFIC